MSSGPPIPEQQHGPKIKTLGVPGERMPTATIGVSGSSMSSTSPRGVRSAEPSVDSARSSTRNNKMPTNGPNGRRKDGFSHEAAARYLNDRVDRCFIIDEAILRTVVRDELQFCLKSRNSRVQAAPAKKIEGGAQMIEAPLLDATGNNHVVKEDPDKGLWANQDQVQGEGEDEHKLQGDTSYPNREAEAAKEFFALQKQRSEQVGASSVLSKLRRTAKKSGYLNRTVAALDDALCAWQDLKEPERIGFLATIDHSVWFNTVCTLVIMANSIFMLFDTNYQMNKSIAGRSDETDDTMFAIEVGFIAFYICELLLKLAVHKLYFFCNDNMSWNIFDAILVCTGLLGIVVGDVAVDPTFLRMLRLLKLVKILRAFRLMRLLEELRVIMNCLVGTLGSLGWSIVMMFLVFFMFGVVFVQLAAGYVSDVPQHGDRSSIDQLVRYFGSVEKAVLTLYKASTGGDDWTEYYDAIIVSGPTNGILFLFFIAFTQIALLNIITGLFIESALKYAAPDNAMIAMNLRKESLEMVVTLTDLWNSMDTEETGRMAEDRFIECLNREDVRISFEMLGLDIEDSIAFYHLLDEMHAGADGCLSKDEFIYGCIKLRGNATSRHMQTLGQRLRTNFKMTLKRLAEIEAHLARLEAGTIAIEDDCLAKI